MSRRLYAYLPGRFCCCSEGSHRCRDEDGAEGIANSEAVQVSLLPIMPSAEPGTDSHIPKPHTPRYTAPTTRVIDARPSFKEEACSSFNTLQ